MVLQGPAEGMAKPLGFVIDPNNQGNVMVDIYLFVCLKFVK